MPLFEKASRAKLRFDSPIGPLSVEDLWDVALTSKTGRVNLNDIARGLNKKLEDRSFVEPDLGQEETQLKFDIVKYIIDTRLVEAKQAQTDKERAETKQKILKVMAERKDKALETKSDEELQALLETL